MAYTTIDDPSAYFQTALYTGNGSTGQNITNDGNSDLQPDWVWAKRRDAETSHGLVDSSRGVRKVLSSNGTSAEVAESAGNTLTAFLSDGFTVGDDGNYTAFNANGSSIVAWQWKANGGTTASNSNGGVTSTVQANTTAGFSIVTWTGDGSDETVGHGLSSAPQMYVVKNRSDATDWRVGQTVAGNIMTGGNGYYMEWNDSKASTNPGSATTWGSTPTAPTSTVFTVGSNNAHNGSGDDFVAYCFHSVQGYSKIGSYTSNNSADGPMVFCGFSPSWVMFKDTSASAYWAIYDNKRDSFNPSDQVLAPNASDAEDGSYNDIDLLSNGFKIRASGSPNNASSRTYIYMAFAESPFVSSEGVPTTAR